MTPFFAQFALLHASDKTTSQTIGEGNGCMGRPPTSNLGGPSPSPPKFTERAHTKRVYMAIYHT